MNQKKNIYCLTPIYNDWESFAVLVQEISLLKQNFSAYDFFIVAVNDGSTEDIPEDFDYDSAKGLSFEITQKLKKIKPRTLGEALNISGVTPAAISILLVYLKRYRGKKE